MLPKVLISISPSRCRQSPICARESLLSPSTALGVAVAALLSRFCRGPEVSVAVGCCRWAVLVLLFFFFDKWFCFTWWICCSCSGFFRLGCNRVYWVLVFFFFFFFLRFRRFATLYLVFFFFLLIGFLICCLRLMMGFFSMVDLSYYNFYF